MSELVPPHGNKTLLPLALEGDALTTELDKAKIFTQNNLFFKGVW